MAPTSAPCSHQPSSRCRSRRTGAFPLLCNDGNDAYRADDTDHGDLLSPLPASGGMTDRQIYDEIITIVVGGLGNTAAALAWTFHELALATDVEARVHAEVDATGRAVAAHVHDEVCGGSRAAAWVWFLIRRALVDTELGGITIPAGTVIRWTSSVRALRHHGYRAGGGRDQSRMAAETRCGTTCPCGGGRDRTSGEPEVAGVIGRRTVLRGRLPGRCGPGGVRRDRGRGR